MKNEKLLSVIMILTAAAGWGVIGVFTRPLTAAGLSAIQTTVVRSLTVLIGMGIFLLLKDKSLFRVKLKDFWIFLGTGLVSIVFFNVCYFLTIGKTTLATASVLLYTAPCFVMLMSAVFFKEKITAQKIAALVIAFLGCALASGFAGGDISLAVLLTGIGSGLGYASYSIFGKVALKKYHTFTLIFYTFFVATIGLLPFSNIVGAASALAVDMTAVLCALGLGLISTFMPYIFYTTGLKHIDAGKASVMAFAEPMVATVAGILIFKETLKLSNAIGILLIFAAIVLLNIPIKKKVKQN
ncbi:MAG: EamA family transporter [Eubacterium sp.]|nr:EamA family transporter [Eubacterium sp.]